MSQIPPAFILEASEILRLSPEILRIAKRNEDLDDKSRNLFLQCTKRLGNTLDPSVDASSYTLLQRLCAVMIQQGTWRKTVLNNYLRSLYQLSPNFSLGIPPAQAGVALYSMLDTIDPIIHPVDQSSAISLDQASKLTATYRRIQLKLNKLEQLEKTKTRLMNAITEDEFIVACGPKRADSVFALAAAVNEKSKQLSFPQKLQLVLDAKHTLVKSIEHEEMFLRWVDSGAPAVQAEELPDVLADNNEVLRRLLTDPGALATLVPRIDEALVEIKRFLVAEHIFDESLLVAGEAEDRLAFRCFQQLLVISGHQGNSSVEAALYLVREKNTVAFEAIDEMIRRESPYDVMKGCMGEGG